MTNMSKHNNYKIKKPKTLTRQETQAVSRSEGLKNSKNKNVQFDIALLQPDVLFPHIYMIMSYYYCDHHYHCLWFLCFTVKRFKMLLHKLFLVSTFLQDQRCESVEEEKKKLLTNRLHKECLEACLIALCQPCHLSSPLPGLQWRTCPIIQTDVPTLVPFPVYLSGRLVFRPISSLNQAFPSTAPQIKLTGGKLCDVVE